MKLLSRWTALPFLAAALTSSALAAAPGDVLQVRAKTLVQPDGTVLEDRVLVIEDGRIRAIRDEVDESEPWFAHDGVVAPGFVACQTRSGAEAESRDTTRSIMPGARLAHAFVGDHSSVEDALAAGITSMVITPSPDNVAGGVTAVVKTADGRMLEREAHLSLSLSSSALGNPNLDVAKDGGLERTYQARRGSRLPTSYAGALRVLRELLVGADDGLVARAAKGDLPVLLEAWTRHEVQRAAGFAKELGLRGALRGASLAAEPVLVEALAESGLGVIVGPYAVGQTSRSLDAVAALDAAGVPFGFALDGPTHEPDSFRLSGAMAIGAGAEPSAVLAGMTSVGARLAGVGDRVGSLEVGKDADFVLWSGHPMNLTSRIEAVYVDGALAWRPEAR